MKVFVSWSGDRGRRTAEIISRWLKQVIQSIEPWMSPDIEKGKRWNLEMAEHLEKAMAGIICLNKDNIDAKWILFEAGALSKMITSSNVCTFLLDIGHEDVESPLADFQNTKFDKEDMRKLVHTLNAVCSNVGEKPLEKDVLDLSFDTFWPDLEKNLKIVIEEKPKRSEPVRTQKEILSEILEIVRSMNRKNQMEDFAEQLAALKIDAQKIGYGMGGQLRNFNEETTIAVPRLAGPVLGVRLGEPKKKDD